MEFLILGPLQVVDEDRPLALSRLKERVVLAVLLLHANEFVSRERLIDELWGESPPPSATKAVNVHLSQLRKALRRQGAEPIETAAGGYRLVVDLERLDVARMRRLVARGRESASVGRLEDATRLFGEALALWRGPALGDIQLESFGRYEIEQLNELRLTAVMDRIDCELSLGRHQDVLGELELLVREHPLHERLRAQHILALYRADRQADALDVYKQTRRLLVDELGIEPGPALQRLQKGILLHDPALEAAAGIAVSDGSATRPRAGEETRKTVTALVCDLAGALADEIDIEARRRLVAQYAEVVAQVLEVHGATLWPLLGEAVLAVFGHPIVHENDALRSVRAAAAVLVRIDELDHANKRRSAIGIGIHTGEVVAEGGPESSSLPSGTVVGVAARLAQAAEPGEVLLAEPTARLIDKAVTLEPAATLRLKGSGEAVPAYRLLSTRPTPEERVEQPFVGRTAELALLRAAWDRALRERRCELVTILGEPGIGKSRVAREFLRSLDATVVTGRCLDYGEGITYSPVVEIVKQLDARPSDPVAAAAIGSLLGPTKTGASTEEIAWAFRKLLQELAAERPLACVVDDIQWAGETLLDLIEHVVFLFSGAPLLVLCLARSEFIGQRAGWPITIRAAPLADDDVERLLPATIGDELRRRIVAAAAGNPLFVEEMVAVADEADGVVNVPPSLRALLGARLEQLEPSERRVLECAAVEGEVFHRGAVQALAIGEGDLDRDLTSLARRELIRPHRPQLEGEEAFRFHHLLIRDAAYDSMTKAARAELHKRFADWFEERPSRATQFDELIGHHLEQAAHYKAEVGQRDEGLEARAGHRFAAAGRRARTQRNAAAAGLLSRALSLLPAASKVRPPLLIELAFAHGYTRDYRAELAPLQEAIELAQKLDDRASASWASMLRSFARLHVDSHYSAAEALIEGGRGREVLSELGDTRGVAYAWALISYAYGFKGEHTHQRTTAERARGIALKTGDEWLHGAFRYAAAAAGFYGPTPLDRIIPELEHLRDAPGRRADDYQLLLAQAYAMQGRRTDARTAVEVGTSWLRELGNEPEITVNAGRVLGELELLAGNAVEAERHLTPCLRLLIERREIFMLSAVAARLGAAMLAQERYAEAARYAHTSKTAAAADNRFAQVQWRVVYARVLAQTGRAAKGERFARAAIAHGERTDNPNLLADAYAALAETLHARETTTEAIAAGERASNLYLAKGNLAGAQRLRVAMRNAASAAQQ
jgi:DNA-binding SARP family transcriptional activator